MARKARIITETVALLREVKRVLNADAPTPDEIGDLAQRAGAQADKLDRYHGGSANLDPSKKAKRKAQRSARR